MHTSHLNFIPYYAYKIAMNNLWTKLVKIRAIKSIKA